MLRNYQKYIRDFPKRCERQAAARLPKDCPQRVLQYKCFLCPLGVFLEQDVFHVTYIALCATQNREPINNGQPAYMTSALFCVLSGSFCSASLEGGAFGLGDFLSAMVRKRRMSYTLSSASSASSSKFSALSAWKPAQSELQDCHK